MAMMRMPLCLIAISAVLWAGIVLLLAYSPSTGHFSARILAGALLLSTGIHFARRRRDLLLSPLFLLAASAILFYSFGTWLMLEAPVPDRWIKPQDWLAPGQLASAQRFASGAGELVVLQFAVFALLAVLLLDRTLSRASDNRVIIYVADGAARPFGIFSLALLALALVPFLLSQADALRPDGLPPALFRELLHAAPPAMSLAVAVLFLVAAGRNRRWLLVAAAAAAVVCAAIFSTYMAKIAIFVVLAGTGAYAIHSHLPLRRAAVLIALAAIFFVTSLTAVSLFRPSSGSHSLQPANIYKHFIQKAFERQATTAGCLQEAIEKRAPDGRGGDVFYFASAMRPRILWPDKPNLSRGREYAFDYCGFSTETYSEAFQHSASITLLGEPIVETGWAGLAVSQAALVLLLSLATLAAARTGVLGAATLVAMLPWLADFDHPFALYFAISSKTFLVMLPLILVYYFLGKPAFSASGDRNGKAG